MLQDLSVNSYCVRQRTSCFALLSRGTTTPHPGTKNSIIHSRDYITLPLFRNREVHSYPKTVITGSEFHCQLRLIGGGMSSICEANGPRPSPQQSHPSPRIALQRPLAKSDQAPSDLPFATSYSSLDQYLADIPPPLRTQKSASSFGSNQEGGASREPAHQQSHGEQFFPPGTAIGTSASPEGKLNDSKSVNMAYQQGPTSDWILPPPTFLEPKTYRASAADIVLARPRLKDLQPHAASDLSVEVTRIQQLDLETEDTSWLPIQKPEIESLVKGPKSAEWYSKDCEYSVLTPSTALPTPKSHFPSSKSEIHLDDEYLVHRSGSASLKDCPVPSPPMYEKSHDTSFYISPNCARDRLYDGPIKNSRARTNKAKVTHLREKQPEEQTARVFPAASSSSSTATSSSRVKPEDGRGSMEPPYGPGNIYENLLNLAPNSRPSDSNNPFTYSGSKFATSSPTIPAKAKQLLGIHPESQSPAMKNRPLRPQTKPSIPFLSTFSKRKTGNNTTQTQGISSVQTGKKANSLRRIITAPFKPADGKGITLSELRR